MITVNTLWGEKTVESKQCSKCNKVLPIDNFGVGINFGKARLRHECKKCANYLSKIRTYLRKSYGNPPIDYRCPICAKSEKELFDGNSKQGSWVVDHCHITDKFKGWLCHKCNRTLGGFDDDPEMVKRAYEYLTKDNDSDVSLTKHFKCGIISE